MALIAMAVYSTEENKKDQYLEQTLASLRKTVNFNKHRIIFSINAQTDKTLSIINSAFWNIGNMKYIINEKNIGTAEAINLAWEQQVPGENLIKMDDDVVIYYDEWVDLMEDAISRDPNIGQIGLKRKDCWESVYNADPFYKTELIQLPHKPGERWITVEKANHIMGTCVMHSAALISKVGYLWQPGIYGFDDSFMSLRSRLAGFKNVFLSAVEIDHIDPGGTIFQTWKEKHAGEYLSTYHKTLEEFTHNIRPIYYNPFKK